MDAVTGTVLYGACFPAWDITSSVSPLLGVSCVDLNLIIGVPEFEAKADYAEVWKEVEESNKVCKAVDFNSLTLQRLRGSVGAESQCAGTDFDLEIVKTTTTTTTQAPNEDMSTPETSIARAPLGFAPVAMGMMVWSMFG